MPYNKVMGFAEKYRQLNDRQREAVDTIDGPVMVIAGPGTGKTELLSLRVANIIQKTDTLPENILCLTFTEAGASNMRSRLISIIGQDAYKVAVNTFHGFGTEVINQNQQFFFNGAHFKPADKIASYEIISEIFNKLDYNNPLISKMNGEYTHVGEVIGVISELKKSGLSSTELLTILDANDEIIFEVEKMLSPVFNKGIKKTTATEAAEHIDSIRQLNKTSLPNQTTSLANIIAESLQTATDTAISTGRTPAITGWRDKWFKKDKSNNFVLISRDQQIKLRAIINIYDDYLMQMEKAGVFDYDDMILQVIRAIEGNDELRFNLQEKYQYILVDEFQDTNMAQMRILRNLTNNEVQGDTPNIMVVGDDDQAIYSFQGADISNILDFQTTYPKAKQITLIDNYRSTDDILSNSRNVIKQGVERLENIFSNVNKELKSHSDNNGQIALCQSDSLSEELYWIAQDIKSRIESGQEANKIAIIARKHSDILNILPFLNYFGVAVNYERQNDALQQDLIVLIEELSQLLIHLANGQFDAADACLPKLMLHDAWKFNPQEICQLSLAAYNNHSRWLDIIPTTPSFKAFYEWLIQLAMRVYDTPVETMLDYIIGTQNIDENAEYRSPIYEHFFSQRILKNNPEKYIEYIESLKAIRNKLREYHPGELINLVSFTDFINLCKKVNEGINVPRPASISSSAIHLLTAHNAKGQEFDTVYIVNAVDTMWGQHSKGGRPPFIRYPSNLPLAKAGDTSDEKLRLFYVAMTRAKNNLHICYSKKDDNGKDLMLANFLSESEIICQPINPIKSQADAIKISQIGWYQKVTNPIDLSIKDLLSERLAGYKLNITHLQNFLNVKSGGPEMFLINNLLQFPQSKNPSASFGTAIHDALQFAHTHFVTTGNKLSIDSICDKFTFNLLNEHLSANDFKLMQKRGQDAITAFFNKEYDSFLTSQQTEISFSRQNCMIDQAHINGKLDLIDVNESEKTITVTDYKTGKSYYNWKGKDDNDKIKLHRYKQQLMFYKLLVENSRDYRKYKVESGIMQFVEPTVTGEILHINAEFSQAEMDDFIKLINAVWTRIINLDLPDISKYKPTIGGIQAFEQDLIKGNIT